MGRIFDLCFDCDLSYEAGFMIDDGTYGRLCILSGMFI